MVCWEKKGFSILCGGDILWRGKLLMGTWYSDEINGKISSLLRKNNKTRKWNNKFLQIELKFPYASTNNTF